MKTSYLKSNLFTTRAFHWVYSAHTNRIIAAAIILNLVFIQNTSAQGWVWAKRAICKYGVFAASSSNFAKATATDYSGNVYTVGYFESPTIMFNTDTLINAISPATDNFLVKYNSNGVVKWARSSGGNSYDYAQAVATDQADNVYMAGYYTSGKLIFGTKTINNSDTFGGPQNIFLAKYDSSGNVIWAKGINGNGGFGTYQNYLKAMTVDASANIYITGSFDSDTLFFGSTYITRNSVPGTHQMFVAKYDSSGHELWAKIFTSTGGSGNAIATDQAGNVYFTGTFQGVIHFDSTTFNRSKTSGFLSKMTPSGDISWAITYGDTVTCTPLSLTVDHFEHIYVTGNFYGATLNIGSYTLTNTSLDAGANIFLAMHDSTGAVHWGYNPGFHNDAFAADVKTDQQGNAYLGGFFKTDSILFGSTTLYNHTANYGSTGGFFVSFDSTSTINWALSVGVNFGSHKIGGLSVDPGGDIYITGMYADSALIFGSSILLDNDSGHYLQNDLFLAKYSKHPLATPKIVEHTNQVLIYPNPVAQMLNLQSTFILNNLSISNCLGEVIFSQRYNDKNVRIDVSNLSPGIYFLTINDTEVRKFLKR